MNTDKHRWGRGNRLWAKLLLVVLLAGVMVWVVRDRQRGPVEVSFEGYTWEKYSDGGTDGCWRAHMRVRNNSSHPISFYGSAKGCPPVAIMKANTSEDIGMQAHLGLIFDWHSIMSGEEVNVEIHVLDSRTRWQGEFKYVPYEVEPMDRLGSNTPSLKMKGYAKILKEDMVSVRSKTVYPVEIGPFTFAGN